MFTSDLTLFNNMHIKTQFIHDMMYVLRAVLWNYNHVEHATVTQKIWYLGKQAIHNLSDIKQLTYNPNEI